MIAIFAISFAGAAIGLLASWFAAKHVRRELVPAFALGLAVLGAFLASQFRGDLEQCELALTIAIGLVAVFIGSSGFLFLGKPQNAAMFSGYASLVFLVTLPLTGSLFACALIQSCP
ncbi:MAG: hypothetical protein NT015_01855 [Alphaproteobacteria bacterium]|nr:hypothetical protein [Alphaproteobacteria bacterium]